LNDSDGIGVQVSKMQPKRHSYRRGQIESWNHPAKSSMPRLRPFLDRPTRSTLAQSLNLVRMVVFCNSLDFRAARALPTDHDQCGYRHKKRNWRVVETMSGAGDHERRTGADRHRQQQRPPALDDHSCNQGDRQYQDYGHGRMLRLFFLGFVHAPIPSERPFAIISVSAPREKRH